MEANAHANNQPRPSLPRFSSAPPLFAQGERASFSRVDRQTRLVFIFFSCLGGLPAAYGAGWKASMFSAAPRWFERDSLREFQFEGFKHPKV